METIDDQVVSVLMNLKPPQNWRKGITEAMSDMLGERNLDERIQEIKAIIKRMDTRWDHGFIMNEEEYTEQRIKLQIELEQLTPVADDELEQAADMLENFESHWNRLKGDEEGRHELTKLIVERAYVKDDRLVAMTLRSNYHLVLNHNTNGPTEFTVDPLRSTCGSDEIRVITCTILVSNWFSFPTILRPTPIQQIKIFSVFLNHRKANNERPLYNRMPQLAMVLSMVTGNHSYQ